MITNMPMHASRKATEVTLEKAKLSLVVIRRPLVTVGNAK